MKITRRVLQGGFLLLTLAAVFLLGANAERWCPFGGVEAIYTYLTEGNLLCSLGISNFYILGGVLMMTLLMRRVFCGYMCPIGTISEWLHGLGRRVGIKTLRVPRPLDRALSLLKYGVLGLILWFTWRAGELMFRGFDPCYALLSRHGNDITVWAYVVSAVIALASLALVVPFCRWFCPLAAVLNPFSRFGLTRVERDRRTCNNCGRCSASCPMAIPVAELVEVNAARCTSCLSCVASCPKSDAGALQWRMRWPHLRLRQPALVAGLLLCTSLAVGATYLFPVPSFVKSSKAATPAAVATLDFRISNLTCRGRANLLVWFLERDDLHRLPAASGAGPGYFKLEAWPDPRIADVRITYDPSCCDKQAIYRAITEPYYNMANDRWWTSPFVIEGYDPFAL